MGREPANIARRRTRNTKRLLTTARTFDVILGHVRNGGSLIDLCDTWQVRYSDIIGWIKADKTRAEAYNEAIGDRSEWTREMILSEIRLIARPDPRKLFYADGIHKGKLKNIEDMDAATARLVKEVTADGTVKLYDRLKAIELGAKSERLLVDKTEHSLDKKLEDILAMSYEPQPSTPAPPPADQEPPAVGA